MWNICYFYSRNFVWLISCDSLIHLNIIRENSDNGIVLSGKNVFARITHNKSISFHKKAGLKLCNGAQAVIKDNHFVSNLEQVIMIREFC